MHAIKKVRLYVRANPDSPDSRVLKQLALSLSEDRHFPLDQLYALNLDAFELAIELMSDWRLDRYYAARLKLFDAIGEEEATPPPAVVREATRSAVAA